MRTFQIALLAIFTSVLQANAQYTTLNAHSHNDYSNDIPFWLAYCNHFGSIEADIWATGDDLIVAHDKADLNPDRTIDKLYIEPLVKLFAHNEGKAWNDLQGTLQLLIDLKTPVEPTLRMLVERLKKYPEVFDPSVNKNAVRVVITGNRPAPDSFGSWPSFVYFDGVIGQTYNASQLERVALFSENLTKFVRWDGKSEITAADKEKLLEVINSVHAMNKKIRFWSAPDNILAWKTLMELKADYINTDHIARLAAFLTDSQNK